MKVEIWSDFVCPFCYIGKRRFESALEQFITQQNVIVEYKSFELDPCAAKNPSKNIYEMLADKYKVTTEKAKEMNMNIARQAKEIGLDFCFDTMKPTNTFDAHRLAKYAYTHGKGADLIERLFHAYFTNSQQISDADTLVQLAVEIGLNKKDVKTLLHSNDYILAVRNEQKRAKQLGITGVPFFVFNEKYAVSGAQPTSVFMEVLEKVSAEEKQRTEKFSAIKENTKTTFCTGDICMDDEEGDTKN